MSGQAREADAAIVYGRVHRYTMSKLSGDEWTTL